MCFAFLCIILLTSVGLFTNMIDREYKGDVCLVRDMKIEDIFLEVYIYVVDILHIE